MEHQCQRAAKSYCLKVALRKKITSKALLALRSIDASRGLVRRIGAQLGDGGCVAGDRLRLRHHLQLAPPAVRPHWVTIGTSPPDVERCQVGEAKFGAVKSMNAISVVFAWLCSIID